METMTLTVEQAMDALKINDKKVYDDNNLIKSIRYQKSSNNSYEDINVARDYISITTLRKDLNILIKDNLVELNNGRKSIYKLTTEVPSIITISEDSLFRFCQEHEEHLSVTSDLSSVTQAYNKIKTLIAWDGSKHKQRGFGKFNQIMVVKMIAHFYSLSTICADIPVSKIIFIASGYSTTMTAITIRHIYIHLFSKKSRNKKPLICIVF